MITARNETTVTRLLFARLVRLYFAVLKFLRARTSSNKSKLQTISVRNQSSAEGGEGRCKYLRDA